MKESIGWEMNPIRVNNSFDIQDLADLTELCRVAGAAGCQCKVEMSYFLQSRDVP